MLAVALGVRALYLAEATGTPLLANPVGDELTFEPWARRVAAGEVQPGVLYQAPGAAWLLGAAYRIFGPQPIVARGLQACLGAIAAVLLAAVAARRFGPRIGWISGLAWALYPPAVFHGARLEKPAAALVGLGLAVLAAQRFTDRPRPARALALGLAVAAAALVAEPAWLLAPWAVWRVLVAARPPRAAPGSGAGGRVRARAAWVPAARALAAWVAGLALGSAPLLVRNALAGAPLAATTSNLGPNLYIGNHEGADGTYQPLLPGRGRPELEAQDARDLARAEAGHPLDDAGVSAHWRRRAWRWMTARPARAAELVARKLRMALADHEWMDALDYRAARDASALLAVLGSGLRFGVLLPLAVLGIALRAGGARARAELLVPALLCWLTLGAFFVLGRLRLPIAYLLVPYAAAALPALARAAPARRARALGAGLCAALLAAWPAGVDPHASAAASWNNVAASLRAAGDEEGALAALRSALRAYPGDADAQFSLGELAAARGLAAEARAALASSARLQPRYAGEVEVVLAELALASGGVADALASLARAQALGLETPEAWFRAGLAWRRAGDLGQARAAYRAALARRPAYPEAANNLGYALELSGDRAGAREAYERALRDDPAYVACRFNLARLLATAPEDALRDGGRALDLAAGLARDVGAESAAVLDLEGLALAELGRYEEAAERAARGVRAALAEGRGEFAGLLSRRETEYRSGRPVRVDLGGN